MQPKGNCYVIFLASTGQSRKTAWLQILWALESVVTALPAGLTNNRRLPSNLRPPPTWSLILRHVTQKLRSHVYSICHSIKPHPTRELRGCMFYRTGVGLPMKVLHCRHRDFRPFCSRDLAPDPMTFIPILPGKWRYTGCANMNFVAYVKAFESYHLTDEQTDRQTDTTEII